MIKILYTFRYAICDSEVIGSTINIEEQSIKIRFKFMGLGYLETILKFLPKKLWISENMVKESRSFFEADSTYYVDSGGKITKHVVDDKDIDHDKVVNNPLDRVREKLAKLAKAPKPAII